MTPEQAWQAARSQLQIEMQKSSFDTWVRDADLVSAHDGHFIVGVQNSYARDWIESRLTSTISGLLTGALGQSCEVTFVVQQDSSNSEATSQNQEERLQRAFATTLASLRGQVSLTDYENHVRYLRLHVQDVERGLCTIIAPDQETILWINAFIRSQFQTLFTASFGQTITLQFVPVADTDPLLGDSAEETIALYTPLVRLRDMFLKDNVGHRYPKYLLRWMPYIGTNAFWTLLALRQAHFEQHHCLPENGRRIQVSLRALAASIGADKNTIQSHRDNGKLSNFIEHIPTERYQVIEQGKVHREAHQYVFHNTVPFTPADRSAITEWLSHQDFEANPLLAIEQALKTSPKELLAAGSPALPGAKSASVKTHTLQNDLLQLCRIELSTAQRAKLLRRIEELQSHILEGLGYGFVTLYFMKHWVPRLGHSAAAFVLLCRQNIYVNEDDGEYREFLRFPTGQHGLEPYAQLLGKSLKTVKRLLPRVEYEGRSAPGRKASNQQNESNRAASARIQLRKQEIAAFIYRALKKTTGALLLYVKKNDPLVQDHQHEYDAILILVSHFLGTYGLGYSQEDIDAFLYDLNKIGVFKSQTAISQISDIGIPLNSDNGNSHDSDISKTHISDKDISQNSYDSKAHISDNEIPLDSDIDIAHDSDNFLKTLNLPEFTYLTEKRLRNYLLKQQIDHQQQPTEHEKFLWTKGVGGVWDNRSIHNISIFQKNDLTKLQRLEIEPECIVSWILYTYGQQGNTIKHPAKFILSRFADNNGKYPSPGLGYDRLAALGPKKLQTLLRNCVMSQQGLVLKRQVSGYEDWQKFMAPEADLSQVRELAETLGLGRGNNTKGAG